MQKQKKRTYKVIDEGEIKIPIAVDLIDADFELGRICGILVWGLANFYKMDNLIKR